MKVRNLLDNNRIARVNQFVLYDKTAKIFQSYESKIVEAKWRTNLCEISIGRDWDFSRTTVKYFKIFLVNDVGCTEKEVEEIKKKLRKGCTHINIGRFVIHYCEDMR